MMPTAASLTFGAGRVDPIKNPEDIEVENVNLKASLTYAAGTILGELVGTDEVQTVTIAGGASGGTFTITFGGQTTSALPYGSSAAVVQAALEALSSIGVGNMLVTKAADVYTLTFRNALGQQNVAQVTASAAGLTGGTPTITPATGTGGVAGTPGTYAPYASGNSDGSQNPVGVLQYACTTDASGNISPGTSTSGNEWGVTRKYASVYMAGEFLTDDLVGLDANAVGKLGRLVQGTVAHGRLMIYGS
jgi:hypothetical protein